MRVVSLASGSKGNAYLVQEGENALLIDCGLHYKTLVARLGFVLGEAAEEILAKSLVGVLITHSHVDHTQGLRVFIKHYPTVPIFANAMTAETVACEQKIDEEAFVCFENGQPFESGPFTIKAFSIPHDTSDPVGYQIRTTGETYFHATDIGSPLDSVGVNLAEADFATLESNHDPVMLRQSGRPPSTIQRIWGPRGHLSNDQSAELVKKFAAPRLKRLALGHLSRDCNTPHFAEETMRAALKEIGREDIVLKILDQDSVLEL